MISPIESLTNLETLQLWSNWIKDISVLENLNSLRYLYLMWNGIDDISSLRNLNNLELLYLENNKISDISALEDHLKLRALGLADNLIRDITAIVKNIQNGGLSSKPFRSDLHLQNNYLDLRKGSQAMNDIQYILSKNINVIYEPQKPLTDITPTVSVVIDNHTNACPQAGLNKADVIYEISVAPGITRFLAIFDINNTINKIGPVRSARVHLVQLAAGHEGSFVHAGGSAESLGFIPSTPLFDFDEIYNSRDYFYRSQGQVPHNLYTNSTLIQKGLYNHKTVLSRPAISFSTGTMPGGNTENTITANFVGQQYDVEFIWDGQRYRRYEDGEPIILDNSVVSTANVIIIHAPHTKKYVPNLNEWVVNVDLIGSGTAIFYRDGKVWHGNWEKTAPEAQFQFMVNGVPMLFAEGNMWILITESPFPSCKIYLSANPSEGGIVSGDGSYNFGQVVTLSAFAEEGYSFVNWTENGTIVSTSTVYTFTVTKNRKLVANFSEMASPFLTRGELTKRFVEAFNLVYDGDHNAILAQMVDVDENHEYGHYIATMVGLGYIIAYPDLSFRPYDTVNRAEYAALLMMVLGYDSTVNYEIEIKDLEGHWAELPICAAVYHGYMFLDEL